MHHADSGLLPDGIGTVRVRQAGCPSCHRDSPGPENRGLHATPPAAQRGDAPPARALGQAGDEHWVSWPVAKRPCVPSPRWACAGGRRRPLLWRSTTHLGAGPHLRCERLMQPAGPAVGGSPPCGCRIRPYRCPIRPFLGPSTLTGRDNRLVSTTCAKRSPRIWGV